MNGQENPGWLIVAGFADRDSVVGVVRKHIERAGRPPNDRLSERTVSKRSQLHVQEVFRESGHQQKAQTRY